ncbi:hypothetical protein ACS0TY_034991 [Phlomoides rotata]
MCQGIDKIKENKLSIAVQKFESFEMLPEETIDEPDSRFTVIMNEINTLGKEYTKRETALKIIRSLPEKWDVFTAMFQNTKDLNEVSIQQLFSELKAFEFDLNRRNVVKTPRKVKNDESHKNIALKAQESEPSKPDPNTLSQAEMLEEMNLMARRFERLNSRFGKYKRFYQDAKDRKRFTQSSENTKRFVSHPHFKRV